MALQTLDERTVGSPKPQTSTQDSTSTFKKCLTYFVLTSPCVFTGFPGGSEVKASASNAGDPGSIPESGRSPGEGNGNPLQYSCLENPMDRAAWQATVHGVAKSRTRLSDFTPLHLCVYRLQQAISDMSVSKGCGERFGDYPTLQKGVRELNDLL